MAEYLIQDSSLTAIGNAIRSKTGKTDTLSLTEMVNEIFNIKTGGEELNFEIIGGTTEPSNPIENTIWINTSTAIDSYVFSYTEPTNPKEGMVWIATGTNSENEFNALKVNNITIYPSTVKQYENGAWVDKPTKNYKNRWIDFNMLPSFIYEGEYEIVDDLDNPITSSAGNWKIRFLTSGKLKFTDLRSASEGIDVFLVGGGGGGDGGILLYEPIMNSSGRGGGGGYTATYKSVPITTEDTYSIVIGGGGAAGYAEGAYSWVFSQGGGSTSAFTEINPDMVVKGGYGNSGNSAGGSGGGAPGAAGGVDGANGSGSGGGTGQGSSTREFGEAGNTLYSSGGHGYGGASGAKNTGNGGSGSSPVL